MIGRFASIAILAAASATFSVPVASAPVFEVRVGPPAPRHEVVQAPRHGWVWSPGYWDWRGRHYRWVAGSWVRERPGYVYSQPTWVEEGGHWHLVAAAWARGPHGDRDRDGIPNRLDRDRDGDGVANRQDRQPDNPRRN